MPTLCVVESPLQERVKLTRLVFFAHVDGIYATKERFLTSVRKVMISVDVENSNFRV